MRSVPLSVCRLIGRLHRKRDGGSTLVRATKDGSPVPTGEGAVMTLSKTGSCPSRTNTLVALGVLVASLSALGPARAQPPPAGVEFQVDSATTATARFPAVATAADGSFVVVWETVARRASSVWGQRFDADGQRVGGKFLVSDSGRSDGAPAVGMDEAGNFLVAWRGWLRRQDVQVLGRFYDSSGTPSGPPFRINASSGVLSGRPISVAMNHVRRGRSGVGAVSRRCHQPAVRSFRQLRRRRVPRQRDSPWGRPRPPRSPQTGASW